MKLLITTLTMIFISFGAFGWSIGETYKLCKPYQNNGFEINGLSNMAQVNSTLCKTTFRMLINTGVRNCQIINLVKESNKDIKTNTLKVMSMMTSNSNADMNAVITSFINFAENNTDDWSSLVSWSQHKFLNNKFPCELKK